MVAGECAKFKNEGHDTNNSTLHNARSMFNKALNLIERNQLSDLYKAKVLHQIGNTYIDECYQRENLAPEIQLAKLQQAMPFYDQIIAIYNAHGIAQHRDLGLAWYLPVVTPIVHAAYINQETTNIYLERLEHALEAFGLTPAKDGWQFDKEKVNDVEEVFMCLLYYQMLLQQQFRHTKDEVVLKQWKEISQTSIRLWVEHIQNATDSYFNQFLGYYRLNPWMMRLMLMNEINGFKAPNPDELFEVSIHLKYPDLAFAAKNQTYTDLQAYMRELKPGQVLLDIVGVDTVVHLNTITANWSTIRTLHKKDLPIVAYKNSIHNHDFNAYSKAAYQLFTLILQDIEPLLLNSQISELLISPSDLFAEVPFAALLVKPNTTVGENYSNLDYLINYNAVRYVLSPALLATEPTVLNRNADVFVPHQKSSGLQELPHARKFGTWLAGRNNHTLYADEHATITALSQLKADVLHISTHAALTEQPVSLLHLWLSDGELTVDDAYQMHWPQKMVVLNTCHSGQGVWHSGDGAETFTRAFVRSGVACVVSNLWAVDEESAHGLLKTFYSEFYNGQTATQALRQAQLQWIKNAPNPRLAAPWYWAGVTMHGNAEIIQSTPPLKRNMFWLWVMAGVVGVGAVLVGLKF